MISHRFAWLSVTAVAVLACSSCLRSQRARHQHALAVKAEAEADLTHAQADALRAEHAQPEYVEAATPPAAPAALQEPLTDAPSSAHVWIAGEHARRGGQWVWVPGRYALPPRADVVWVPGHWVPHLHGYAWIEGAWR